MTAIVPLTAGFIRRSSFLGISVITGDAVCTIYVLPSIAPIIDC